MADFLKDFEERTKGVANDGKKRGLAWLADKAPYLGVAVVGLVGLLILVLFAR